MNVYKSQHIATESLDLFAPSHLPIAVETIEFNLVQVNGHVRNARLSIQVTHETYARIDAEALFNLKPEVRGQLFGGQFDPATPIEIELALHPSLLQSFAEWSALQCFEYLLSLSQTSSTDPLVATESWFGLYVKQQLKLPPELAKLGEVKTGYSSQWVSTIVQSEDDTDE